MKEKIPLLLQEIVQVGKLEDYNTELDEIVKCIKQNGCEISTTYIEDRSCLVSSKTSSNKNRIRLSLKEPRSHPLDLIWDLLHEFGHHQSGPKQDTDDTIEREELAWELAEIELAKYPRLLQEVGNFISHKNNCLKTYKS